MNHPIIRPDLSLPKAESVKALMQVRKKHYYVTRTDRSYKVSDYVRMNDERSNDNQSAHMFLVKHQFMRLPMIDHAPIPQYFHLLMFEDGFVIDEVTAYMQGQAKKPERNAKTMMFFAMADFDSLNQIFSNMSYDCHLERAQKASRKENSDLDKLESKLESAKGEVDSITEKLFSNLSR